MKGVFSLLVALLLLSGAAFAHGDGQHVKGTVKALSPQAITIETPEKAITIIKIMADTRFTRSGDPAALKDLKVGDRVVIDVKKNGRDLIAESVRFGAPKGPVTNQRHQM